MARPHPDSDPDGFLPSCHDQPPRVSIRPLRQADLAALLAHLDGHDQDPGDTLNSGVPAPVLAVRVRASVGRPGASDKAEYRRRRAAEVAAWTHSLPWRIGAVLAVGLTAWLLTTQIVPHLAALAGVTVAAGLAWRLWFRPSPEAQAWRRAADGERFVARLLDPLAKQGWGVEHDLPVRGATANLDHVVIGPPGIFAIDVRHYRGRLRLSHDGLLWHGRTFLLPTLSTIRSKADRLQDRIGAPDVAVSPIVAVLGGMVPGGQATAMGVTVVSARRLPGLLRNLPPNLTTERAREVAAQMNQRLDAEPAPEQPGNELRLEY